MLHTRHERTKVNIEDLLHEIDPALMQDIPTADSAVAQQIYNEVTSRREPVRRLRGLQLRDRQIVARGHLRSHHTPHLVACCVLVLSLAAAVLGVAQPWQRSVVLRHPLPLTGENSAVDKQARNNQSSRKTYTTPAGRFSAIFGSAPTTTVNTAPGDIFGDVRRLTRGPVMQVASEQPPAIDDSVTLVRLDAYKQQQVVAILTKTLNARFTDLDGTDVSPGPPPLASITRAGESYRSYIIVTTTTLYEVTSFSLSQAIATFNFLASFLLTASLH